MDERIKSDILKIGWYQIIGGIIGLLLILYTMFGIQRLDELIIIVYIFTALFFSYSIICGILCLKLRKNALQLSLINQFLQLIQFAVLGVGFKYVAGIYFYIGVNLSKLIDIHLSFGSSVFQFNFNSEFQRSEINFNLIAFGLIYWIDMLRRKLKSGKINFSSND